MGRSRMDRVKSQTDAKSFGPTCSDSGVSLPTTSSIKQQHEGCFETDLVSSNCGQMTRVTPEMAPRLFKLPRRNSAPTDLTCTRPASTADLRWNRFWNLEASGPEVQTLPPGHRGRLKWMKFVIWVYRRSVS
ncbi:hypothetical protein AVEN_229117-1 [Araneus ventricosus]|uniref:Uncharacterized protein n=1 Tax=Araneus ventricosus TaxID=182803 RepID=A0A4Y2FLV2_ARAVE|nr:hypothetical protein AVEN_229117-1 [Araneus ventricosus]